MPHAVAAITPSGTGTVNTTYAYDANGNMTSGNGRTTSWTSFNMVATIGQGTKTVAFDYDGEHARIRQVTNANTTLYLNDPGSGLRVERATGTSGNVQWNEYLFAGGRMVGEHFTNIAGGVTTTATRYFIADHLGSIAVITDESGAVVERLSYDAWGKRRFASGADDPTGSIASQTTRGFTGHEMIDDVGLVNMNGRIYDPQIGRFMSADPYIQDSTNGQSLNRYSYTGNNPLSYVDPSGYSFVIVIVAVVLMQYYVLPALEGVAGGVGVSASATSAVSAAGYTTVNAGIAGAVGGYIATGTVKGAIIGRLTAAAFYQVGNLKGEWSIDTSTTGGALESAGLYGVVDCTSAKAGGRKCGSGFLAAGFSDLASTLGNVASNDNFGGLVANAAQHAVVGGRGGRIFRSHRSRNSSST